MASPSPPPYRATNTYDDDDDDDDDNDGYYIARIRQILLKNPNNDSKASSELNELLKDGRNEGRFYDTDEFNNLVVIAKQKPVFSLGGKSKRSKSKRSKSKRSKSKRTKRK